MYISYLSKVLKLCCCFMRLTVFHKYRPVPLIKAMKIIGGSDFNMNTNMNTFLGKNPYPYI